MSGQPPEPDDNESTRHSRESTRSRDRCTARTSQQAVETMAPDNPLTISRAPRRPSSTSQHTTTSTSPSQKSKTSATPKPTSTPEPLHKPPSWFTTKANKLSTWLATSEPSAQALVQHRRDSFQRAGLSPTEPEPHAKLHAPIGDIPPGAIQPTTGPTPEEVMLRKTAERSKRDRHHHTRQDTGSSRSGPTSSDLELWTLLSSYGGGQGSTTSASDSGSGGGRPWTGSSTR